MPTTAPGSLPEITDSTRQALTLLLRHGPMARVELARRLDLSPPALTKLTRPLIDRGVLMGVSSGEGATPGAGHAVDDQSRMGQVCRGRGHR